MRAKKAMLYTLAYAGWLTGAFAQEAAAPGAAPAAQAYGMSFAQAWEYGGWIMWLLAAISVFALAMVFYFLTALRGGAVIPRELMVDLMAQIRSGNLNEVRRLCDRHPCPLSAVTLTALDCLRNVPQCDVALLRGTAEAEGARQAEAIQGQTELLLDIATIAPLLGLLGTVLGITKVFRAIGAQTAVNPAVLANGIWEALTTTIIGLAITVPVLCFTYFFRMQIIGFQVELTEYAGRFAAPPPER